jgi:hypothetical protein
LGPVPLGIGPDDPHHRQLLFDNNNSPLSAYDGPLFLGIKGVLGGGLYRGRWTIGKQSMLLGGVVTGILSMASVNWPMSLNAIRPLSGRSAKTTILSESRDEPTFFLRFNSSLCTARAHSLPFIESTQSSTRPTLKGWQTI